MIGHFQNLAIIFFLGISVPAGAKIKKKTMVPISNSFESAWRDWAFLSELERYDMLLPILDLRESITSLLPLEKIKLNLLRAQIYCITKKKQEALFALDVATRIFEQIKSVYDREEEFQIEASIELVRFDVNKLIESGE